MVLKKTNLKRIGPEMIKKNVKCSLKVKVGIITTLGLDKFLRVYHCEIAKEMWGILQITHEGTTKVKMERLDILTHEYGLFKMKLEYSINQMQARFTHIVSHMRTPGKIFSNEEIVKKNLRCLNCS